MKVKLILRVLIILSFFSFIQTESKIKKITWDDLSYVAYRNTYSPKYNTRYDKPIFSKSILKMHGSEVEITGYIIPISIKGDRFFLSAYPNSSCFFCGGGEKHTILDLKLKNMPANYKVDEYLTFKGILKTHTEMINYPYSLENAALVTDN